MRPLIGLIILAMLPFTPASAQSSDRDEALAAMQACRDISVDSVRLACMDAAAKILDGLEEATAPEPRQTPLPSTDQPVASTPATDQGIEQAAAELEAERARLSAERAALEAEKAAIEKERTELAELEETETTEKRERRRGGLLRAPRGLGLFDGDDRPKRYETLVTRIVVNSRGRHFFETEGGTTWRQVPPAALRPPSSLPAKVTIRRSASGARRLAFEEHPSNSYVVVETKLD